jgi:hypothetical protein
LITDTAKLTIANDDYLIRYTEAKSVLDTIADWQTHTTPVTTETTAATLQLQSVPPI